ncbi:MAG: hypothetical protein KF764_13095 [Labilithrix sp.]|nr:hypothetical protein [Labilithrix sp.]
MGPGLGVLAWPGTALLVYAIASTEPRSRALYAYLSASAVQHVLWFWWSFPLALTLPPQRSLPLQLLIGTGMIVVVGLPVTVLVSAGIVFARRRLPVCAWLPLAWVAGEQVAVRWTSIVDDWVSTQVDNPFVMRLVHWLGALPALFVCLTAAAAIGEGLATRRRLYVVPVVGCLLLFALAPRLEKADPVLLEGIGVTHLRSRVELPSLEGLSPPPDLVVWPEQVLAAHPRLEEGPTPRTPTLVPFWGSGIEHVVGAITASSLGMQNALLHVSSLGRVEEVRAKRVLFPVFERSFLGVGSDWLAKGVTPPRFTAAGRSLVPLVCGEILTRTLVMEGVGRPDTVVTVSADDGFQTRRAQPSWMVLSQVRLRAVELGVPIVYASVNGQASIVDADGTVLARSAMDAPSGILTWSPRSGARDHLPPFEPSAVVLFDRALPELRPDCPPGRCRFVPIDEVHGNPGVVRPARTVIVSGHGTGDAVASLSPERVASAVAAFSPDLVVLDTCFGASTTLLAAIARETPALVVASSSLVNGQGLVYDPSLFGADPPEARALAANSDPPSRLYVGHPEPSELRRLEARTAAEAPDGLRPDVKSWSPALVARKDEAGRTVLVPVDWRRVGQPPPPPHPPPFDEARSFGVRALWLEGSDVEHRAELDAFLHCLVERSNYETFFRGKARISYEGSWEVPLPRAGLDVQNRNHAVERMVAALPPVSPDTTPVYLVFGLGAQLPLYSACGYHDVAVVDHGKAVLSLVRTTPPCWPAASLVRSETQIAMHEIAEGIDLALGHQGCVANGRCEGGFGCDRPCDAFTGLFCDGAPEETPTGCGGQTVRGWAVQKLAHKGWDDDECAQCAACDFAIEGRP